MRSMWKGIVSFGLVSIPVQLYSATQEHSVPLHQVHAKDGSRIRMRRVCEEEGEEVPYRDIAKGYEAPDGRTVVLSDEDLANLPLPSKKTIDVLAFVDADTIDPLMFSNAYYVSTADRSGAKPYTLLRQALEETGQIAVTKVTLRTRESLAVLRVHEDVLVLQTMLWPDEVRPAAQAAPDGDVQVRPQELKMALSLMATLSEGFELSGLHDEYQEALQQVVEARLQGVEPPQEEAEAADEGNVIDLMAALRGSVKAARRSRGEAAGDLEEEVPARAAGGGGGRASGGRAAAKKAAGSKDASGRGAAPGKTAAKKTAAAGSGSSGTGAGTGKRAGAGKGGTKKPAGGKGASSAGTPAKKTASKTAAKKTASRRRAS